SRSRREPDAGAGRRRRLRRGLRWPGVERSRRNRRDQHVGWPGRRGRAARWRRRTGRFLLRRWGRGAGRRCPGGPRGRGGGGGGFSWGREAEGAGGKGGTVAGDGVHGYGGMGAALGGALFVWTGEVVFDRVTFQYNVAIGGIGQYPANNSKGKGGAIFLN